MAAQSLAELARGTKQLNSSVGAFRQLAARSNNEISKVVKDLSNTIFRQKRDISNVSNSIEEVSSALSQSAASQEATATAVRESNSVQTSVLGELRNITSLLKRLNATIEQRLPSNGVAGMLGGSPAGGGLSMGGGVGAALSTTASTAANLAGAGALLNSSSSGGGTGGGAGSSAASEVISSGGGKNVLRTSENEAEERIGGTRSWRNNNPGNLVYNSYTKGQGAIGSDGKFAIFPSMDVGRTVKERMMFNPEGKYANLNLTSAMYRYAPPKENNTNAYINFIVKSTGIRPDAVLGSLSPEQRKSFLAALEKYEGYKEGQVRKLTTGKTANLGPGLAGGAPPKEESKVVGSPGADGKSQAAPTATPVASEANSGANIMEYTATSPGESARENQEESKTEGAGNDMKSQPAIPTGNIVGLGKTLQSMGFHVSEHPAFGRVGKHSTNSRHYRGMAIDINAANPDGSRNGMVESKNPVWSKKFDDLASKLHGAGYNVIWREPGHDGHMHVSVGPPEGRRARSGGRGEGVSGSAAPGAGMGSVEGNAAAAPKFGVGSGLQVGAQNREMNQTGNASSLNEIMQEAGSTFRGSVGQSQPYGQQQDNGRNLMPQSSPFGGLGGMGSMLGGMIGGQQGSALGGMAGGLISLLGSAIESFSSPAELVNKNAISPSVQTIQSTAREDAAASRQQQMENAKPVEQNNQQDPALSGGRIMRDDSTTRRLNDRNILGGENWNVSVLRYFGLDTSVKTSA